MAGFALSTEVEATGDRFLGELETFDGSLEPFREALLTLAERFQKELREDVVSSGSRLFMAGDSLSTVVFRLYQQTNRAANADVQRRALDVLDALLRANVGRLSQVVRELEP